MFRSLRAREDFTRLGATGAAGSLIAVRKGATVCRLSPCVGNCGGVLIPRRGKESRPEHATMWAASESLAGHLTPPRSRALDVQDFPMRAAWSRPGLLDRREDCADAVEVVDLGVLQRAPRFGLAVLIDR